MPDVLARWRSPASPYMAAAFGSVNEEVKTYQPAMSRERCLIKPSQRSNDC